jgi:CRISPR-associated protein Csd1
MLLQRLREYSNRLDLPPTLYAESPVRYIVELDASGRLLNPDLTDTADPSSARTKRGQRRLVPQIQRSSGIKALLLADKADYALGFVGTGGKPDRVAQCHLAFISLLRRCAEVTSEDSVVAVGRFLARSPVEQLNLGDDFDPSGLITFRVDGTFPIDLPEVQRFWAEENDPAGKSAPVMQCLVCGSERPVLDRLQAKIKGVPGGQTSGTSIISANAEAFESYGLEASLIAPTCADCGERFTKATNELLASETNRYVLGGASFIFWTKEDVPFNPLTFLRDPQPDQVKSLVGAVHSGQQGAVDASGDGTAFYATVLSGSGGRAVVRDWLDTTVGEVKSHLRRWFALQQITGPYGEDPQPLGLYPLAAATVRDARDLAPPTPRAMLRAALAGTPLPLSLLFQAVRRNRVEQGVTRPRAALIKAVWLSHQRDYEEDFMVQLDESNDNPAYRCGRLFAVLEQAQRRAVPGINATIADRFFGTASSAPASVFGRLLRGAQPHLAKLQRDRPGAAIALQSRLEEILGGIGASGFPRTLALEDQGLFALGYYHQRAFDRAQAREGAERRKAAVAIEAEPADDDNETDQGGISS